jgi:hypothetical protein
MPLQDGEPADESDIWLRNITNKDHLRKDGKLKSNALTGKAISAPLRARPWDHELLGRLLFLTNDFEAEGRAFCQQMDKSFIGVMYASVLVLRRTANNVTTDVRCTPNKSDTAHADLTMVGTNDDNVGAVRDWLQDTLSVSRPTPCRIASVFPRVRSEST